MADQVTDSEKTDLVWKILYRIGGAAALMAAGFALLQSIIEIISVGVNQLPVPASVLEWFTLLQSHTLVGLTELTVFQIPAFVLCVPVFLALYVVLKQTDGAYGLVATALAIVGIAVYLASNSAFSMLSLSGQYAAAATEAQRSMFLAAGQAMLAIYEGSGVDVGLFIFLAAVLMISVLMLRNRIFSRLTAYLGMLTCATALAYYISSAFTPMAIFIFEAAGGLFVGWLILVGLRLLQRGKSISAGTADKK